MASISASFIPDINSAMSNSQAVFSGNNYRITILTERLIRLEFNLDGSFCNTPTLLVQNRAFPVPAFKVEQDERYLVITTKYFMLQYMKNKPFLGPKYAPDTNLKVVLNNTDKVWYYGHPEARNYKTTGVSLDNFKEPGIKVDDLVTFLTNDKVRTTRLIVPYPSGEVSTVCRPRCL